MDIISSERTKHALCALTLSRDSEQTADLLTRQVSGAVCLQTNCTPACVAHDWLSKVSVKASPGPSWSAAGKIIKPINRRLCLTVLPGTYNEEHLIANKTYRDEEVQIILILFSLPEVFFETRTKHYPLRRQLSVLN